MKRPFAAIVILVALSLGAAPAMAADDLSKLSIVKEPAKLIAGIYQSHHDWKLDEGIALATKALDELDTQLKKSPEALLPDPKLKTRKVKQVASALHTLLGMLDQRKALKLLGDENQRKDAKMQELAGSKKKIDSVDIERQIALEKEAATLSARAVSEFRRAIEIDPANPSPHYELAKIYAQGLPGGGTAAAEEEYYQAAVAVFDEGDAVSARATMQTLAALNPKSKYLAQFEERTRAKGKTR